MANNKTSKNGTNDKQESSRFGFAMEEPAEQQFTNKTDNSEVPEQYRALQDSQMANDDSLTKLRADLEQQSVLSTEFQSMVEEKLDELSSPPEEPSGDLSERLAELEERLPTFGADARVDAIMLRVAELERKFGQGTPDPLVNEIIHRLGALEGSRSPAAGDDSRLDEVEVGAVAGTVATAIGAGAVAGEFRAIPEPMTWCCESLLSRAR